MKAPELCDESSERHTEMCTKLLNFPLDHHIILPKNLV